MPLTGEFLSHCFWSQLSFGVIVTKDGLFPGTHEQFGCCREQYNYEKTRAKLFCADADVSIVVTLT